jgi:hypothetical protein
MRQPKDVENRKGFMAEERIVSRVRRLGFFIEESRSHEKEKMFVMSHEKDRMAKGRSHEKDKMGHVKSHEKDRMVKGRSHEKDKMVYVTSH